MISNVFNAATENAYIFVPIIILATTAISIVISDYAIPVIKKLSEKIYNSTVVLNLRSFFCEICASNHHNHLKNEKIDDEFIKKNLTPNP